MTQAESVSISIQLTTDPIGVSDVPVPFGSDADGAVNVFLGNTRNHHQGRGVLGLEYHCYEAMAAEELRRVAVAVAVEHGLGRVLVVHRLGQVGIGETSLVVAVASHHREQALLGTLALIDRLKRDVPIWKREFFADGTVGWVEGAAIVQSDSGAKGEATA